MPQSRLRTKLLAHIEMMRPYTMFHASLLAVAGAEVASSGQIGVLRLMVAALATWLGWEAGLYAGDYHDRHLDLLSKPGRPVPSGRVLPTEALSVMLAFIILGCACSLWLSPACLALALITTALGIAYARIFKERGVLGNLDRGVLGACAVLFGALVGGRQLDSAVLLLALLAFTHDTASNLVGALRDIDGDRAAGYRTAPVAHGTYRVVHLTALLAFAAFVLAFVLLVRQPLEIVSITLYCGAVLLALTAYLPLLRHSVALTRRVALRAHEYLVLERILLLSAIAGIYLPAGATLLLVCATVAVTLVSQMLLRGRYEAVAPIASSLLTPGRGTRGEGAAALRFSGPDPGSCRK
jgi:4-hydroxybenzoate polyprenyltransferase/geranylgeranylglycerol-phosphate geranylgeranyltransferase